MGMWGHKPWDNDEAADWYGEFMDNCQIRKQWLQGMDADIHHESDTVRAAIGVFILLGHVYVWPIDDYDSDLELCIQKMERLFGIEEYKENEELMGVLRAEHAELCSRRKDTPEKEDTRPKPWWKFW